MKTIREGRVDRTTVLRLVDTGKMFVGLAISGGATKVKLEGDVPEDVWKRLHNEVAKADPKYVGFAGARNRFLHFFPIGFHSDAYDAEERGYKVAAKVKLDQMVPLADAPT